MDPFLMQRPIFDHRRGMTRRTLQGGEGLRPSCVIRSGKTRFFSVAIVDARYRVMKVAWVRT